MTDPYAQMPEPKTTGDYPDRMVFNTPGQSIEGTLVDTRWKDATGDIAGCQVLDIQQADGNRLSVFCGPTSLHREVFNKRPAIGSMIRVTFRGFEGQAKVFTLDVAPGTAAPAAPPVQAAAPAAPWGPPAGNGEQASVPAAPWGQ